ncbi:ComEA family DNA-binding protein [Myxococcota bacterium]
MLKAVGIGLLMLALAGIGATSSVVGAERGRTGLGDTPLGANIGSAWLRVKRPSLSVPDGVRPAASGPTPARSSAPGSAGSAKADTSPGLTADGKVILNRAAASDLTRLPGIGPKRAEAILALRARLGRFSRTTDLLRVRGIGAKRLRRISPLVIVDIPEDK